MPHKTYLLLTVGGSHQPLVRSIQQNRPDFIIFLCSVDSADKRTKGSYSQVNGEGLVCKSAPQIPTNDLPSIATQCQLAPEDYNIKCIEHFDNLNDCYLAAIDSIDEVRRREPDARILADYTGGTKSMTAGLAAAALDDGNCELKIVTGVRQDLKAVTDQTEFSRPVHVWDAQTRRRLKSVWNLTDRFDYAGAVRLLEETLQKFFSDNTQYLVQRTLAFCQAFDAWDRFDHQRARQCLQPFRNWWTGHKRFLAIVLDGKGHGWEPCEDLLLNAARRAAQHRFDDAVGRQYRALELVAQTWLAKRYQIETANVDLSLVPDAARERLNAHIKSNGRIAIGLQQAWELTTDFPDDPLAHLYQPSRKRMLQFLSVRNQSLFAHGQRPITANDYNAQTPFVEQLIKQAVAEALKSLGVRQQAQLEQFPRKWDADHETSPLVPTH